jgi:hypothetical protein
MKRLLTLALFLAAAPLYAADLTVTASSVKKVTGAAVDRGTAGASVTAGQPVYKDATDSGKLKAADADAQASSVCVGIALHAASTDQPLEYLTSGPIDIGATVTVGQIYVVSTTAGGIAPYSDLASGDYVTVIGVGTTTGRIEVRLNVSQIAKP